MVYDHHEEVGEPKISSHLEYIQKAMKMLERRHMLHVLEPCRKVVPTWNNSQSHHGRSSNLSLYNILKHFGTMKWLMHNLYFCCL